MLVICQKHTHLLKHTHLASFRRLGPTLWVNSFHVSACDTDPVSGESTSNPLPRICAWTSHLMYTYHVTLMSASCTHSSSERNCTMGSFILSCSHQQHHFLFEALAVCTVEPLSWSVHADSSALTHTDEMLAEENTADAFWGFMLFFRTQAFFRSTFILHIHHPLYPLETAARYKPSILE